MKRIIIAFLLLIASTSFALDLKDATLIDIITERPDLVADIKANKDEGHTSIAVEKDELNRRKTWTENRHDAANNLVGQRIDTYTYYETGEVKDIVQKVYDAIGIISDVTVTHYIDGTRPTVKRIDYLTRKKYAVEVSLQIGKINLPFNTIVVPDSARIYKIYTDAETGSTYEGTAYGVVRYKEVNIYDEETREIIETILVEIPGVRLFVIVDELGNYKLTDTPSDPPVMIEYVGETRTFPQQVEF